MPAPPTLSSCQHKKADEDVPLELSSPFSQPSSLVRCIEVRCSSVRPSFSLKPSRIGKGTKERVSLAPQLASTGHGRSRGTAAARLAFGLALAADEDLS